MGLDKQDLIDIRQTAIDALKAGKVITRYSYGGLSVDRELTMDTAQLLGEANYALWIGWPEEYPKPASSRGRSVNMRYTTTQPL